MAGITIAAGFGVGGNRMQLQYLRIGAHGVAVGTISIGTGVGSDDILMDTGCCSYSQSMHQTVSGITGIMTAFTVYRSRGRTSGAVVPDHGIDIRGFRFGCRY